MTDKTVLLDKNWSFCEVGDTRNWSTKLIYEMFEENIAEKLCEYWGK